MAFQTAALFNISQQKILLQTTWLSHHSSLIYAATSNPCCLMIPWHFVFPASLSQAFSPSHPRGNYLIWAPQRVLCNSMANCSIDWFELRDGRCRARFFSIQTEELIKEPLAAAALHERIFLLNKDTTPQRYLLMD